jgi:hypothetical protein
MPVLLACNRLAIVSGARAASTICPLSVKITALVLLPLVMSMTLPFSRPSWMMRLVGAEFGEAIAMALLLLAYLPRRSVVV